MLFGKKKDYEEETEYEAPENEEELSEKGSGYIVIPIILEFLLGAFVWIHARNAAMNYLYALVPMLLATAFTGTYVYNRDGDMKLFAAVASLASIGIALQMAIDELYATFTVFSPLKLAFGFFIAIFFILVYDLCRKLLNHSITIYIMLVVSACIYGALYFFGTDPNGMGTLAWISADHRAADRLHQDRGRDVLQCAVQCEEGPQRRLGADAGNAVLSHQPGRQCADP